MDIIQVHIPKKTVLPSSSLVVGSSSRNDLLQSFFNSLKIGVEIWSTTLFEGQFQLDRCLRGREVSSWYRLYYRLPRIWPEPGDYNVSIVKIEKRHRE